MLAARAGVDAHAQPLAVQLQIHAGGDVRRAVVTLRVQRLALLGDQQAVQPGHGFQQARKKPVELERPHDVALCRVVDTHRHHEQLALLAVEQRQRRAEHGAFAGIDLIADARWRKQLASRSRLGRGWPYQGLPHDMAGVGISHRAQTIHVVKVVRRVTRKKRLAQNGGHAGQARRQPFEGLHPRTHAPVQQVGDVVAPALQRIPFQPTLLLFQRPPQQQRRRYRQQAYDRREEHGAVVVLRWRARIAGGQPDPQHQHAQRHRQRHRRMRAQRAHPRQREDVADQRQHAGQRNQQAAGPGGTPPRRVSPREQRTGQSAGGQQQ